MKSYDQKNKKDAYFLKNPNFSTKIFKSVYLGQNLFDFLTSYFDKLKIEQETIICCSYHRKSHKSHRVLWAILTQKMTIFDH
jgi:hypothetical protein